MACQSIKNMYPVTVATIPMKRIQLLESFTFCRKNLQGSYCQIKQDDGNLMVFSAGYEPLPLLSFCTPLFLGEQ